jgi:hypothetical protein
VHRGRPREASARAARRLPPKRCRIIGISAPNATPASRDPGVAVERVIARHPRAVSGAGATPIGPRSGRSQRGCATFLRGTTRRRGIPGPNGPHHGYRPARRPERRVESTHPGRRPSGPDFPAPPAGLPAPGERPRRGSAAGSRRRGRPRTSAVGSRRRLRGDRGLPGRRPGTRRRAHLGCPHRGAAAVGRKQGLHRRRGGAPEESNGADKLGTAGVQASRSADGTSRRSGGDRRATSSMIAPAVQRDRAGGALQDLIKESA